MEPTDSTRSLCPRPDQLPRIFGEEGSPEEQQAVADHLEQCAHCARRYGADDILGAFRRQAAAARESINTTTRKQAATANDDPSVLVPDRNVFPGLWIESEMHRGGQGVVYKAVQQHPKRMVAIKVIAAGPAVSNRQLALFQREVNTLGRLDHPHIVRIYESGVVEGRCYFVMEYVRGERIDEYVRAHELGLREILSLFGKVCATVSYAHQRGVIHCDLKPGNILVTREGEPRILDFGLAKIAHPLGEEPMMVTLTGQLWGTPAYMAPEQAQGAPHAIDVRTDVYALGVILYQLITGHMPYAVEGTQQEVLYNVSETLPKRPREVAAHVNSEIEAILFKALEKDPDLRYQSVSQLQNDMHFWLTGLPIVAKSISSIYLLRKLMARHRYTTGVVGLMVLILLGAAGTSIEFFRRERLAHQESAFALTQAATAIRERDGVLAQRSDEIRSRARSEAFAWFLWAWNEGLTELADELRDMIAVASMERAAADAMILPVLKTSNGRERPSALVEFVNGERLLRAGRTTDARNAYWRCAEALDGRVDSVTSVTDKWLGLCVRARLNSLDAAQGIVDAVVPQELEP